jgi:hypothetical protein
MHACSTASLAVQSSTGQYTLDCPGMLKYLQWYRVCTGTSMFQPVAETARRICRTRESAREAGTVLFHPCHQLEAFYSP